MEILKDHVNNIQHKTCEEIHVEKLRNNNEGDNVGKPKGVNPFGEARPREQVLAEKGQDWKKIDEQLESVKIKETSGGGGDGFGKRGFGSSNGGGGGRAILPESRTERTF